MVYKVQIYYSKCSFPTSIVAIHGWFVIDEKERWEVTDFVKYSKWGHLHKDFLPPTIGWAVNTFKRDKKDLTCARQKVHLLYEATGKKAEGIAACIRKSPKTYPFNFTYKLFPGPNSNTYLQWVINKCNIPVKLPSTAIGKNYVKKF